MADKKKPTKKSDDQEPVDKNSKLEAQQKKAALTDYEKRLAKVKQLKLMTDTEGWRQLYQSLVKQIASHAENVLDHTLTSKDVMYHQQGVRVLRDIINRVRAPLDSVNSFEKEMPLFAASEISERAEWDDKTGAVIIK